MAASRQSQSVDAHANNLTVALESGSSITYDPRRLKGVNVFREVEREFAAGDRVQFTAPNKDLGVANRDLGTGGQPRRRPDDLANGRQVRPHGHVRHGGVPPDSTTATPSPRTAPRASPLGAFSPHIDTDSSQSLINNRLAYVAISRASDDARVYTNNAETLGERLASDITKTAAVGLPERGFLLDRLRRSFAVSWESPGGA